LRRGLAASTPARSVAAAGIGLGLSGGGGGAQAGGAAACGSPVLGGPTAASPEAGVSAGSAPATAVAAGGGAVSDARAAAGGANDDSSLAATQPASKKIKLARPDARHSNASSRSKEKRAVGDSAGHGGDTTAGGGHGNGVGPGVTGRCGSAGRRKEAQEGASQAGRVWLRHTGEVPYRSVVLRCLRQRHQWLCRWLVLQWTSQRDALSVSSGVGARKS